MKPDGKAEVGARPFEPDALASLGLGPDAPLLQDPKLFLDTRFLASLIVELDTELGAVDAARALFHIGAAHGVREASRVVREGFDEIAPGEPNPPAPTSLVMQLAPAGVGAALAFGGTWPECHEASARLARLGRSDSPACHMSAGYTSGWLSEIHNADLVVVERTCAAMGAEACTFEVRERHAWAAERELPVLDRGALAAQAAVTPAIIEPDPEPETTPTLDENDDAVHVWGPVMVLPFTRPEDSLSTLEMLGRDPSIDGVRVVIVDLRQVPLDPGMGIGLLERGLETIEGWGAEIILTGVCALTAPLLADLVREHMVSQKELADAVASAFQIAEAQRHPL